MGLFDQIFFFFYLTILQPDITGYRGRKKSTFYIIFSQFFYYTKIKGVTTNARELESAGGWVRRCGGAAEIT